MAKQKKRKTVRKKASRAGAGVGSDDGGPEENITNWTDSELGSYVKLAVNQGDALKIFKRGSQIFVSVL
jgi:hypothetical protein